MPRRNANVRTRNLPRAAQRQPRRTLRTQFDVDGQRASSRHLPETGSVYGEMPSVHGLFSEALTSPTQDS